MSGFAAAFIPTTKPVLAKAFTVFAFCVFVTSPRWNNNYTWVPVSGFLSLFAFEYEINPVIHRPYLQTSECLAIIEQDSNVSGDYSPAPRESSCLYVARDIDAISSTPSTPLASPNDASTSRLETPVTSPSTNTSPCSAVTGSFTCCHCQEVFYRRCDLK